MGSSVMVQKGGKERQRGDGRVKWGTEWDRTGIPQFMETETSTSWLLEQKQL